jgi:NtrC-family two-component system sensor histidine kinase KinB
VKRAPGIRAQFLVAGALLVAVTAVSSAWSAYAFHEVSQVVDATVSDSERTTAATAALATALEREDDALLLTLTDEARGQRALDAERASVGVALGRLDALLTGPAGDEASPMGALPPSPTRAEAPRSGRRSRIATHVGHATAGALARDVAAYHAAGDALVAHARDPEARLRYHEEVNPLLRRAVAGAARVRDDHFRKAQEVASWARDRAARATGILGALTVAALVVSLLVALYLASAVVLPIRALTAAVEAMRRGDFERRVPSPRGDELGQLADGFNRMAADLGAFRRANVSEVIRAKETLEATLAALPDAVVVIGPEGSIASQNARATTILAAATPAPEEGRTLSSLPVSERTKALLEAALREGRRDSSPVVDLSQTVPLLVGEETRNFLQRVVPIEGLPEGRRGAVLVLSDVTDLVHLDAMRTELVAVASHELRTPLTTLRMTLLLLQERAASLEARDLELVRTALLGVDQLAGTVDEFLDLTLLEAGQLRLDLGRVDLGALAQRDAASFAGTCEEAGISLTVTEPQAPAATLLQADAARLHVVLANLLANAVKYTPAGGRIGVRVGAGEGENRVEMVVTDTGPGVPAEFRERIFEKFFRVEHHRKGDAGVRGAGIGLYVAKGIVTAHGGSVRYEAAEGGGARIVVALPRVADGSARAGRGSG